MLFIAAAKLKPHVAFGGRFCVRVWGNAAAAWRFSHFQGEIGSEEATYRLASCPNALYKVIHHGSLFRSAARRKRGFHVEEKLEIEEKILLLLFPSLQEPDEGGSVGPKRVGFLILIFLSDLPLGSNYIWK